MQLPLAIFLIPYGLFLLIFGIFSLVDIAHVVKYRSSSVTAFAATAVYLAVAVMLLYGTWYFISDINWREYFQLFGNLNLQPSLEF